MKIKRLSPLLASQIAAGEVIERPASVLKELLENCLDAGSNKIDVFVERGGIKLIRVQDNGVGICKEDLNLALEQHATSKITMIEDLDGIGSLGFRGEALASIAAVSQLEIISKPASESMGWKVANNVADIMPASLKDGTTVIVRDLFHNIPARRKFLRSERTEFNHLEEVFKRIALSHFQVAFSFTYNDRELRRLPACESDIAKRKRLAKLCGDRMVAHSMYIDAEQNGLRLWGWLGLPDHARSQADCQFFYINNRMVKDRLINHAVRQALHSYYEPGRYPTYCLYLELDVKSLDVNVHPTKHEVRFHNARVVHAFLNETIQEALEKSMQEINSASMEDNTTLQHETASGSFTDIAFYKKDHHSAAERIAVGSATSSVTSFAPRRYDPFLAQTKITDVVPVKKEIKILGILGEGQLILAKVAEKLAIIDIALSRKRLMLKEFENLFLVHNNIPMQALLMPMTVNLPANINVVKYNSLFTTLGFQLEELGPVDLLIRQVPMPLHKLEVDYKALLHALSGFFAKLANKKLNSANIIACIELMTSHVNYQTGLSDAEALSLVQKVLQVLPQMRLQGRDKSPLRQFTATELMKLVF